MVEGLTVTCRLDGRRYPTGRMVTKEEMKQLNVWRHKFHGEWDYVIKPREQRNIQEGGRRYGKGSQALDRG